MEKIINFLKQEEANGIYTIHDLDYSLSFTSYFINYLIIPRENSFLIRYALIEDFDRWANSGYEEEFSNEEQVIAFLKNKKEIFSTAVNELVEEIVEEAYYNKDKRDDILQLLIDMLQNFKSFDFD